MPTCRHTPAICNPASSAPFKTCLKSILLAASDQRAHPALPQWIATTARHSARPAAPPRDAQCVLSAPESEKAGGGRAGHRCTTRQAHEPPPLLPPLLHIVARGSAEGQPVYSHWQHNCVGAVPSKACLYRKFRCGHTDFKTKMENALIDTNHRFRVWIDPRPASALQHQDASAEQQQWHAHLQPLHQLRPDGAQVQGAPPPEISGHPRLCARAKTSRCAGRLPTRSPPPPSYAGCNVVCARHQWRAGWLHRLQDRLLPRLISSGCSVHRHVQRRSRSSNQGLQGLPVVCGCVWLRTRQSLQRQ